MLLRQEKNPTVWQKVLKQLIDFEIPWNLECPKPLHHSLFHDWLRYFLPLGVGGAVTTAEDEDESMTQCLN